MNTDQIAAEAASICISNSHHKNAQEYCTAIIKAAIEKATVVLEKRLETCRKANAEILKSRAEQAGRPWTKLPEIVGSCNCLTKTPDPKYHLITCRYRQIMESHTAIARIDWMLESSGGKQASEP